MGGETATKDRQQAGGGRQVKAENMMNTALLNRGVREAANAKRDGTAIDKHGMRPAQEWPDGIGLMLVAILWTRRAFKEKSAVSAADLAKRTGADISEVLFVLRNFVCSEFIIDEVERFGEFTPTKCFFIETEPVRMRVRALSMARRGHHLQQHARLIAQSADARQNSVPMWLGTTEVADKPMKLHE